MFTGIIEEVGEIVAIAASGEGARITVRAPGAVRDAVHGESIAVSGVCLTVVDFSADTFNADVMKQTLDVSALAQARVGLQVNIEKALAVGARLGGHIVQGHVDGVGTVQQVRPGDQWQVVRVGVPHDLAPLVVDKGSITVDGTSLTVSAVSDAGVAEPWLEVSLIPETLSATTLGSLVVGDRVNLETDVLARHVERLMAFRTVTTDAVSSREGGSR
ncbi:riboflavin synthase [Microbacterium sp. YY-01]|uniref:riboflavin synthase n=1 Tax=Microbacterium sp. YY-01 TaxID=3421634 RepID=UPI003D17301F